MLQIAHLIVKVSTNSNH